MANDPWDPGQYQRFRDQRLLPALDLIALVEPQGVARALDLGCGTGEPSARLLAHLGPEAQVHGIDTSAAMLAQAAPRASARLTFALGDAGAIESFAGWDLVFANASLHWVPDHRALFSRLLSTLGPGAQLAVQVPGNQHHPGHQAVLAVASRPPFRDWLGGFLQPAHALPLEDYAQIFFEQRVARSQLVERVYSHVLESSAEVAEWTRGTTLLPYLDRLDERQQQELRAAYAAELDGRLGRTAPYLYTFRRLFLWARR